MPRAWDSPLRSVLSVPVLRPSDPPFRRRSITPLLMVRERSKACMAWIEGRWVEEGENIT